MMTRRFWAITCAYWLGMLLWAGMASAQSITSYQLRVYIQGGGSTPTLTHGIPAAEVQCGQARPAPPTGTQANPRYVRWEDPANAAQDCVWDSGATAGPLFSLPFSSTLVYEAGLVAVNTAGSSAESARSNPFSRPGVAPATPGNVRVTGGS